MYGWLKRQCERIAMAIRAWSQTLGGLPHMPNPPIVPPPRRCGSNKIDELQKEVERLRREIAHYKKGMCKRCLATVAQALMDEIDERLSL